MRNFLIFDSVERVKEYLDVSPEAPTSIPETRPPHNWPAKGSVEFSHYSTRYRNGLPYALHDISLNICPGEKIGIVGRTGAGKTSLTAALFRALEACEGSIRIDDVDISMIGLHDLRSAIAFVPQGMYFNLRQPSRRISVLIHEIDRSDDFHGHAPQQPRSLYSPY